jgi:RHS repeat-associated protein
VSSGITPAPTYDANGNQKTAITASLTWNALNLPITVATTARTTTATYDALGLMVEMDATASPRAVGSIYRPDGALLAIYNWSSGLTKGQVPLPGGSTAIYNASGLSYIRHKDWLGSSRLATTWAHAVYSKEAYAPFGETYNEAGTADRSFTGQDQDIVTGTGGTGVYDFLFRKYDPSGGRWMSPDPSGWAAVDLTNPQSLNRYAYVTNNPLAFIDPLGLDSQVQLVPEGNGCFQIQERDSTTTPQEVLGGVPIQNIQWGNWYVTGETCPGVGPGPTCPPGQTCSAPGQSGNGGAPSKGKSPARQQCEAQAAQTLNSTVGGIKGGFTGDLILGAAVGVFLQPVAGCGVVGAVFSVGGPGAALGGCAIGALAAMNPASLTIGALQGMAGATVTDTVRVLYAKHEYNNQMAACSQVP